jgi:hypothetical protein
MSIRNPYSIIATIEYADYPEIRELLLNNDIVSIIKPLEVNEKGEPVGTMVNVYVHLYCVEMANDLLADGQLNAPVDEPVETLKVARQIARAIPFLNKPIVVYLLYLLFGAAIIAFIIFALLNKSGRHV